ncbi:MAG: (5-formylfuran-3-yl)methyl phosphate synthase [Proteobacteria bacterium]|nr:(5-formylfuran-3-yl)methyl phosphate synthase [Pseudomonadota bacterium]
MTGMLASVISIAEANIVLKEDVDIIDLKNPNEGALGALETNIVSAIVNSVNGIIPTSATIGDIEPCDPNLLQRIINMAKTGVDFVKVGLFDITPPDNFIQAINKAGSNNINIVIVLFAEDYSNQDTLKMLLNCDIKGVMLDTKNKSDKNLCSLLDYRVLEEFVNLARTHELLSGLAGSLCLEDIDSLLNIEPDYLGFRGALCSGHDRIKSIDPIQIRKIRNAVPQHKIFNYDNREYKEEVSINGSVA